DASRQAPSMLSDPGIRCNRDCGSDRGRGVRSAAVTLGRVIVRGGPPGARFDLREDAISGRGDAGILLDDDEVSGYHAIVRFVDGRRLTGRSPLVDGSLISVGQTELRVVMTDR